MTEQIDDQPQQQYDQQNDLYIQERDNAFKEIDYMRLPIVNIRRTSNLAVAPVNLLGMSMGIFMFSCAMMKWIDFRSPVLATALIFGGICEYIMGIYDWYQGKTVLSFNDFLFGFIHLVIYYSVALAKNGIQKPFSYQGNNRTSLIGTFFTLLMVCFLILIVAVIKKGVLYIVNYGILILAMIFMMVWQYNKNAGEDHGWAEVTSGYILFFASLTIFITGTSRFINEIFQNDIIRVVNPPL